MSSLSQNFQIVANHVEYRRSPGLELWVTLVEGKWTKAAEIKERKLHEINIVGNFVFMLSSKNQ